MQQLSIRIKRNTPVKQNTKTYLENKMGYTTTLGIAETELSFEDQVAMHLRVNHYPSVPLSMVQPCIDAILAHDEMDYQREIDLNGNLWRGLETAPASAIIDAHHLEYFIADEEF
jgi:hypothetical protein